MADSVISPICEAIAPEASFLEHIETTARDPLPASYQAFRIRHHEAEYQSAVDLYAHFDNIEGTVRTENLLSCRKYAWFSRNINTGLVKVVSNACRLRWCPICAQVKTNIVRHCVTEWLQIVHKPKFFTLTLKHSRLSLKSQIDRLQKQFRLFRQHKIIKKNMRGGVWFLQITFNKKTMTWHPHLHCLLDSNFIDHRLLSQEWYYTTGDSFVVDIRSVKNQVKAANEVARYSARPCKLTDFSKAEQIEIFQAFFGKRLCGSWGTAKKMLLTSASDNDVHAWQRLTSWSEVITQANNSPPHRAILKAFLMNTPLDLSSVSNIILPVLTLPEKEDVFLTAIKPEQLVFEVFR